LVIDNEPVAEGVPAADAITIGAARLPEGPPSDAPARAPTFRQRV
jgi:hypothetical protein